MHFLFAHIEAKKLHIEYQIIAMYEDDGGVEMSYLVWKSDIVGKAGHLFQLSPPGWSSLVMPS